MLFHSQLFLILFLPPVASGYYLLAARPRLRVWMLVAASLFFYGYWDARLVPLLVASVGANWLLARAFGRRGGHYLPAAGIVLNLAVIGAFKYADFFAATLAALTGTEHQPWNIILPLGISFFTFQQIAYQVDLARGDAPRYGFSDYALFVTFFPQLVAGPIVRHSEIIFQFSLSPLRDGVHERLSRGLALFVIGLIKKTMIADGLAVIATPLFDLAAGGSPLGFAEAWLAALAYTLQLYFDFSGYSDMAIGLGLMFGFTLPTNFNAPYRAVSIRDFWRRWHMTLSRFLRDYVYFSLGGGRRGPRRRIAAVLATMLLGGLWHGAGWTFVVWGGLHGVGLAVNGAWHRAGLRMPAALGWLLTMLFVIAGWVLFRAADFATAAQMLGAMAGGEGLGTTVRVVEKLWKIAAAAAVVLAAPTSQRLAGHLLVPRRSLAVGLGLAAVLAVLKVGGGENFEFIYFQF